ncbi:MAG: DNA-directed RNA polymerase subunit alpha [Candidatus Wallbacteria bacterium]|nr:DNA-directed RNA polymerase subunit alpha [Candidatus Wallbacteria bacterium]
MIEITKPTLKLSRDAGSKNYGKFVLEPLQRGYGQTLGNALRRLMLSSMPGSAITSVRIEGVLHEFSAVEGIVEDVIDIILNLKKIVVRSLSDRPSTLKLRVQGPRKVTAADVEPNTNVEIINPDAAICELTKDITLDMEMQVERGMGYRLARKNTKGEYPLNTIFMDCHFSPIVRVNYKVEDTRVGQELNYDKLTFEVWTNGAQLPAESIKLSAKMLQAHLDLFLNLDTASPYPEEEYRMVVESRKDDNKNLDISIKDLEFSVRSRNCLEQENIRTLGELAKKRASELLAIKNFGKKSLHEIREKLQQYGLSLRDEEGTVSK